MSRQNGFVKKGWGHELIWVSNDSYCGKLLKFNRGAKCSMHFHAKKEETWFILDGKFLVECIDTENATTYQKTLQSGDTWHNEPLKPHQVTCIEAGTIIEVSTADSVEDNYRVGKGDSQR